MHSIESQKITKGRVSISENLGSRSKNRIMVEIAAGASKIPVTPRSKQTGGAETKRFSTGYCTYTARGALGHCDGRALKGRGHRGNTGLDLRSLKGIILRVYIVLKPFSHRLGWAFYSKINFLWHLCTVEEVEYVSGAI